MKIYGRKYIHISKLYIKCRVTSLSQYTKNYVILKLTRNTFEVSENILENDFPKFSKL